MTDKKSIWDSAAKAGLALGGISVAYLALTSLLSLMSSSSKAAAITISIVSTLLWMAKFAGCLLLLRFFMLRWSAANPDADNSDTFRFGRRTALLSALVYSGCYLSYTTFINPGIYEEAFEILKSNPMMNNNASLQAMQNMLPMMPTYTFFGNLIYCWLFGVILSAIYSRNIPSKNPF